jgi:phage terminase small subunit
MTVLTPKQKRFCEKYLIDLNATQATVRAGYSPNGARVTGCRLLTNPNIQTEIQRHIEQIAEKNMITVERIIQEISNAAFFDPRDLFDEGGRLRDIGDLPEHVAKAINSFDVTTDGEFETTKKVRLWSKLKALELLGRYLQIFEGEMAPETATQVNIAQVIQNIQAAGDGAPPTGGKAAEPRIGRRLREIRQKNRER